MPALAVNPWTHPAGDPVREVLEREWLGLLLRRLIRLAPGSRVLDLGCGAGLVGDLLSGVVDRYVGVDLYPPEGANAIEHDLRHGLGPMRDEQFDLFVASFGIASHIAPAELRRLMEDIAHAAAPGALVAIEALGLYSLEWPGIWDVQPGRKRMLEYRLAGEVCVHPWSPVELAGMGEEAGMRPIAMLDRTVQFGPKLGTGDYWPGLPPLRTALRDLLCGRPEAEHIVAAALPPLPAHPAAGIHHGLAACRRRLVLRPRATAVPEELGKAAWTLEPRTGLGIGHGLMLVARA